MRNWQAQLLRISTAIVVGTGIIYFVMKDLLTTNDPFAIINHPWQPLFQKLHLLSGPLMIYAVGIYTLSHVIPHLKSRRPLGRLTGVVLCTLTLLMALSGYLIQMISSETWLSRVAIAHIGISFGFTLLFGIHLWLTLDERRSRQQQRLAQIKHLRPAAELCPISPPPSRSDPIR